MTEEAAAVLSREGGEGRRQSGMKMIQVAGRRLAQMGFEFGKRQFNGIEVGAVRWQVTQANPASREWPADVLDFVCGEVIEDERVALAQLRTQHLLQIDGEDLRIHRSFHQKGSGDAFMAQSCNEGGTLPVALGDGTEATLTNRTATMQAGHLGVQTCFIDKHQPADIPVGLPLAPKLPGGFNIRPILLGGASRFFYSSDPVAPGDATRR
jgi:hypothetical protein